MSVPRPTGTRNMPSLLRFFVLAVVIGIFLAPLTALAHNVNVFAYAEGDKVITESYFNDGRKCLDSTIEVFDTQGNKLAEGKTDAEGRFAFRPSIRTDLLIRLTASMGHRAEYDPRDRSAGGTLRHSRRHRDNCRRAARTRAPRGDKDRAGGFERRQNSHPGRHPADCR